MPESSAVAQCYRCALVTKLLWEKLAWGFHKITICLRNSFMRQGETAALKTPRRLDIIDEGTMSNHFYMSR